MKGANVIAFILLLYKEVTAVNELGNTNFSAFYNL
jgi:hypothetical protein